MIWAFIAGMFCGAVILILLILVNDRSFLDLLAGRFSADSPDGDLPAMEAANRRGVAVGSDT